MTIPTYFEYGHAKFANDNQHSLLFPIPSFTELIKTLYIHILLGKPTEGKARLSLA
jgi:hypothetical protein